MPSNKETLFQDHICSYLEREHEYHVLESAVDPTCHVVDEFVLDFIKSTQPESYASLQENYGADADNEILTGLKKEMGRKPLWLLMRNGVEVKGVSFKLYKPQPRSQTSDKAFADYQANQLHYKKEYYYNPSSDERIDLVIWLNGLPIIVTELKHEDEGQNVDDAIYDSFLKRNLGNEIYKHPFLYVVASDCEVKVATNPTSEKNFRWFNAQLRNQAENDGEYPVEHLYRDAFSKESICAYLENFLVFVPVKQSIDENKVVHTQPAFTIFPRYHQLRASRKIAGMVQESVNETGELGVKLLVNHSAGSGKTLTIAWLADQLDSLYDAENNKVFDNIVILTDRKALDKNIKDDLENFSHLRPKLSFAKKSRDLADHLNRNRDIIVTTIHKFGYIQDKLEEVESLKSRKIAFLIDEAHRSQEGRMAVGMRQMFTTSGDESEQEEEGEDTADTIGEKISSLDMSNQVFVAFTATTTQKTVDYFGEPIDLYSEMEAIKEGYILDTAQSIISYDTLYHISTKSGQPLSDKEFPSGVVGMALKRLAYNDEALIQYKAEVMVKLFLENVEHTLNGKGKAMVVASSRPAGLKFYKTIKMILEEKELPYKALYAFSDFTDPESNEEVKEDQVNQLSELHGGKLIEEVFEQDDHRILIVANKFQTGFDQPKLTAMFLDKVVNGVTAIQTVSRLNRKHPEKDQDDILVVDFTNNADNIFKAFNKHREGSPYEEKEPDPSDLLKVYEELRERAVFSDEQVAEFIESYINAEEAAQHRESEMDALLSDIVQSCRSHFEEKLTSLDDRKEYIGFLKRFSDQYYFQAKFFDLPEDLHRFIIFADGLSHRLISRGKTSQLGLLLKNLQVSKGAVTYVGDKQLTPSKRKTSGGGGGAHEIPTTTLEGAIKKIMETHDISDEDAIVIREICEEVAEKDVIRGRVMDNKENEPFLQSFEKNVRKEVSNSYEDRELWDKLEDPIYIDIGGIISIMSKSIIEMICKCA